MASQEFDFEFVQSLGGIFLPERGQIVTPWVVFLGYRVTVVVSFLSSFSGFFFLPWLLRYRKRVIFSLASRRRPCDGDLDMSLIVRP